MDSARENLEQGLGNIDQQINRIKESLQKELESFRVEYQANLSDYFHQQNDQLEGLLGKQKDGLLTVIEKYKDAYTEDLSQRVKFVEQTQTAVQEIVESTQTLENLVQAVSLFDNAQAVELITQTHHNTEGVVALNKSYTEATDKFSETITQLEGSLTNYFENTTEKTEKFFKEVDAASATIMTNLTSAANALVVAQTVDVSPKSKPTKKVVRKELENVS